MAEKFTPGLLSLNLNIMYVSETNMIYDEIKALSLRQRVDHKCVENVLRNMIAILKTKLPQEKVFAKEVLEDILKTDQHNLNALADLEHIYRSLHRVSDADRCKSAIEKILDGQENFSRRSKAICLMQQGYALVHDMSINLESSANSKLTDAHKMLQVEHQRSENERKDILRKCVYHNKQALSHLDHSVNFKRTNPYFIRKIDSLQKFEQALALCSDIPHKLTWSYYIGEAWNRHVDSLHKLTREDGQDRKKDITDATCKALEFFFDIITTKEPMPKKRNTYVSRSLALVGHILIKRSHRLDTVDGGFTFLQNTLYTEFRKHQMKPLEKAYKMQKHCPDSFVLNRYGRALYNLALKTKLPEKQRLLEMAEDILTTSINNFPMNWFAYCTRMKVYDELSKIHMSIEINIAFECLKKAYCDGHQCFLSKGSAEDMNDLSKICQKIAKFPRVDKFGSHNVRLKDYLFYAVDYLQHGLYLSGPSDYLLAGQMGSCLYDLGEFITASEWMKRSLALSKRQTLFTFKITCLYLLKRYQVERTQGKEPYYLIKEIVFMLLDCEKKCKGVSVVYECLIRNDFTATSALVTDIAVIPNLLRQEGLNAIKALLQCALTLNSTEPGKMETINKLLDQVSNLSPLIDVEINLLDEFQLSKGAIPTPEHSSLVPDGFEYHFFVSHSQNDTDWVNNVLLFDLENAFSEEDFAFKGCIADRDFQPGKSIIRNITEAIQRSCKIILVLTRHFIASRWCKDEMEKAIIKHISGKDCVIPLLLEPLTEDEYPACLSTITYLDVINLTDEHKRVTQMGKLKRALLHCD